MPNGPIDLHTHTCFSDGSMSPDKLIDLACEKGLQAIGITDHDTVDGILALRRAAYKPPGEIEVVAGIELSSEIFEQEIHILGYFVNPLKSGLTSALGHLKETREARNLQIIERLNTLGVAIGIDDLPAGASRSLSRAHIAQALVERGYSQSINEAFSHYLSAKVGIAYIRRERLHYGDVIGLIHEAGGLAFLAHLNQITCKEDELYTMCKTLKQAGLDGIEGYYSEYGEDWQKMCAALMSQFHFLSSGGSDFHGAYKKGLQLGTGFGGLHVPYVVLERMKQALHG